MKTNVLTPFLAIAAVAALGCADEEIVTCDPAAPDCPADTVCVAPDGGDAECRPVCDPADPASCGDGTVCDRIFTGLASCFQPVLVQGRVFEQISDMPYADGIAGARVSAVGASGESLTGVAVSDSEGSYELRVPATRDVHGVPVEGAFTMRAAADGYQAYPSGIRPAFPLDVTAATSAEDGTWILPGPIGLIPLPDSQRGLGSISGKVLTDMPGGTLVVAECTEPPCPLAFADLSGEYVIFNVPDGSYSVKGYKAGYQLEARTATVTDSADLAGVDIATGPGPLSTLSGSIQIVNPEAGDVTSVVLIPESVFEQLTDTYLRGEVPPGLRAPEPGLAPDVEGAFTIAGIPDGDYVVLAAFENDGLIRDPDPKISGTQVVHVSIPDGSSGNTVTLGESFKITGALPMIGPGASGPEAVDAGSLTFRWEDDSSEDQYVLSVYDTFGTLVWENSAIPGYSGDDPVIAYAGPALVPGMYYQWRAVSLKDGAPKSTTEDLLGLFFVPIDE